MTAPLADHPRLPGTDYAKVKFVGMAGEMATPPELRADVVFKVTGIVIGVGEELVKDEIRDVVKIRVISIVEA